MGGGHCDVTVMRSHPGDRVDAQDVEAFGHDGGSGITQEHPPHVDLYHLTCQETETEREMGQHIDRRSFQYHKITSQ